MTDIVTALEARAGNKPGEAIGTYNRSIVFLPQEAMIGETVRVRLVEIKPDSRNRMMYRGLPAADVISERWVKNGDQLSCVKIITDWRGNTREDVMTKTRKADIREGAVTMRSAFTVEWGTDLATTFVEESPVRVTPIEEEGVESGSLVWRRVSEVTDPQPRVRHPVKRIEILGGSIWQGRWAEPAFNPSWTLDLSHVYESGTSERGTNGQNFTWGSMPTWYQDQILAKFPLCACGRRRRNESGSSPERVCSLCRDEEVCSRCGKVGRTETVSNALVCSTCQPSAEQEDMVERHVPMERRNVVAHLAKELLTGECVPHDAGMIILRSFMEHIPEGFSRNGLLDRWNQYPWYYFTKNAVYGSRFPSSALQVLSYFNTAIGDGLVELAAWIGQGDYFAKTQAGDGCANMKPHLTKWSFGDEFVIANKLCGSAADRASALQKLDKLKCSADAKEFIRDIETELRDYAQDYAAVLVKIEEVSAVIERRRRDIAEGRALYKFEANHRRGGIAYNGDGWVIRLDGSRRDPDERDVPRYKSDGTYRWNVVEADELALRWVCDTLRDINGTSLFQVVKRPVREITVKQLNTVREIEAEIGALEGAFGLNAEMSERFEKRVAACYAAIRRSKIIRRLPESLDYRQISGENGVRIYLEGMLNGREDRWVSWSSPFEEYCDSRNAQLLESFSAADGVLDVLAYEKYGQTNIAIRWRTMREGESQPKAKATLPPPPDSKPADAEQVAASLAGLQAKFRKRRH